MFVNSIKTILAVGIVAAGAAVSITSTASAGGNFGVYIGGGHGNGNGVYNGNRKHRNHGYRNNRYNLRPGCSPRRALNKAHRIGVNRPHVARINHKKIVVVGYNHGHPAKVIFKRNGHGCKIIKIRGLR